MKEHKTLEARVAFLEKLIITFADINGVYPPAEVQSMLVELRWHHAAAQMKALNAERERRSNDVSE